MGRDERIAVQRPQHACGAQVIAPPFPEFGADSIFAGQLSKMAGGGNNFLFVGKPLPRQHVSNRRSAPCIGFGGMRVFVGHAIDAHQMRIMTLRDRSRTATYVLALRRGVEENGDISPDRQQGLRSSSLRLSRSEEHTSELQSLMRISYAVFCLKKKK